MAAATAVGTLTFPLSNFRLLQLEKKHQLLLLLILLLLVLFLLPTKVWSILVRNFHESLKVPLANSPSSTKKEHNRHHGADSTRNLHTATAETMHELPSRMAPTTICAGNTRARPAHHKSFLCACQPRSKGPEFNNRVSLSWVNSSQTAASKPTIIRGIPGILSPRGKFVPSPSEVLIASLRTLHRKQWAAAVGKR